MARWGYCDYRQLKKLQEHMMKLQSGDMEKLSKKIVKNMAQRMLRKVLLRTPVETGQLRQGWGVGQVQHSGDTYIIEIINNTSYAPYVEYGHRQEPGRYVPAIGKRLKNAWVPGQFFITISERELEADAPKIIERYVTKYLKECFHA